MDVRSRNLISRRTHSADIRGRNAQFEPVSTSRTSSPKLLARRATRFIKTAGETLSQLAADEEYVPAGSLATTGMVESQPQVSSNNNEGATMFNQITYLGSSSVADPKNERMIQRVICQLNAETVSEPMDVFVSIPTDCTGCVRLFEANSNSQLSYFYINRVIFCARGKADTPEKNCFSFTYQNTGPDEASISYQCHVFRCSISEAVGKIVLVFASTFNKTPANGHSNEPSSTAMGNGHFNGTSNATLLSDAVQQNDLNFQFDVFVELKEDDGKGGFSVAPLDKNCFKLRRCREKKVIVTVQQTAGPAILHVQKCFGLLLGAGRNAKRCDMYLLDMQSMGRGNDDRCYIIEALWDPSSTQFEVLNTETPKDTRVNFTIATDVVLAQIHEPVRFAVECRARVFHHFERFWNFTNKPIIEQMFLTLKLQTKEEVIEEGGQNTGDSNNGNSSPTGCFEVVHFESATEREMKLARANYGRSPSKMASNLVSMADDDESDGDEPLLSGSGGVSTEWSADVMANWDLCLTKWRCNSSQRPKELMNLIKNGVPDALRGGVWELLCCADVDKDAMLDTYKVLIVKDCPSDQVITRDIHRTFPAHDFFKEAGGIGQDALYKLSRAYSLYDEEVGYCQGLSFLAASLLLHMPEEQAFGVLIKIMYEYNLRDMFKAGFDALQLRFYQLSRLIEDYIPDLHQFFTDNQIHAHMYASQWFLTLFTAKFPLSMVFHIIDLFLCEGINTIFHIALALLRASKRDLMMLDFEGALKYFRVALPRRYRTEDAAKELIMQAVKLKISHKRLTKYEKEYIVIKQRELENTDPLERLTRENDILRAAVVRLETENDDLANDLIASKINLRNQLDAAEDTIETLQKQLEVTGSRKQEYEDESKRLLSDNEILKAKFREELGRLESDLTKTQHINMKYKEISSDLSLRLENQQNDFRREKKQFFSRVKECSVCSSHFSPDGILAPSSLDSPSSDNNLLESNSLAEKVDLQQKMIDNLEVELAATKLALVQTEVKSQDLRHELTDSEKELKELREENDRRNNRWINRAVSSVKEAAKKTSSAAVNSTWVNPNGPSGGSTPRGHERSQSIGSGVIREDPSENSIHVNDS